MKYYFEYPDAENCFTKGYFKAEMNMRKLSEIKVFPAKIVHGESYFWCSHFQEVGERGESCGRLCGKYSPRNGKNGRCRYHNNCYEPSDTPIIIKKTTRKLKKKL